MKNQQKNTSAMSALLPTADSVDTLETNSLCCAAAGIIAPTSATTEALIPHEKLRGAALSDATLTAPERQLAQPALGYTRSSIEQAGVFRLDGINDGNHRERIGNAVPRAAARAMADVFGMTLLLSEAGETFMLSNVSIWVQPVAIALSMAQQGEIQ